ncbi:hypothetical protein F5Y14DRAFT_91977 [Nemania sp. NC0429]|nr:hypothetical protein F5Y14DRAFT_91977 [Nemania sp. NC0429]
MSQLNVSHWARNTATKPTKCARAGRGVLFLWALLSGLATVRQDPGRVGHECIRTHDQPKASPRPTQDQPETSQRPNWPSSGPDLPPAAKSRNVHVFQAASISARGFEALTVGQSDDVAPWHPPIIPYCALACLCFGWLKRRKRPGAKVCLDVNLSRREPAKNQLWTCMACLALVDGGCTHTREA